MSNEPGIDRENRSIIAKEATVPRLCHLALRRSDEAATTALADDHALFHQLAIGFLNRSQTVGENPGKLGLGRQPHSRCPFTACDGAEYGIAYGQIFRAGGCSRRGYPGLKSVHHCFARTCLSVVASLQLKM